MLCSLFCPPLFAQQKTMKAMIETCASQDSVVRIKQSSYRINKDGGLLQNVRDTLTLQDTGDPSGLRVLNIREFPLAIFRQVFSKERLTELANSQNNLYIGIICIFDASGFPKSVLMNCRRCPDLTPEEFIAIEKAVKAHKFNFTYSGTPPRYHRIAYTCGFKQVLQSWESDTAKEPTDLP